MMKLMEEQECGSVYQASVFTYLGFVPELCIQSGPD